MKINKFLHFDVDCAVVDSMVPANGGKYRKDYAAFDTKLKLSISFEVDEVSQGTYINDDLLVMVRDYLLREYPINNEGCSD